MTDVERVRKLFKASRKQFGEVFLGKSETTVKYYEKGKTKIPAKIKDILKAWETALDKIRSEKWNTK